ncbi:MAG: imidazole glycerol phosphate synthase subunit HisH [Lachnospiraceae bacterium]|jgi:glutamine amidotransferase|nr:imidazole glycerol phosphate synthase subunit HisH [Lachnospiraceae bacterium]
MKIGIIDYGAGNIQSVTNAFDRLGTECVLSGDINELLRCDHLVLPGVGSFGAAMDSLNRSNIKPIIEKALNDEIPFLGICLGLQLLYEKSEESPDAVGLSVLNGVIKKIPSHSGIKIPHMGWDNCILKNEGRLFAGIPKEPYLYFVHSYYLDATDKTTVTAVNNYGVDMDVSIEKNNFFACQFHPEKSGDTGMYILKNFMEI